MKKVVAVLAVVALSFSNVACDKKAETPAVTEGTPVENAEVTPTEEAPVVEAEAPVTVEGEAAAPAVVAPAEGEAAAKVEEPAK